MKNKFLKLLLISASFVFYSFNSGDKSIKSEKEINNEKLYRAFEQNKIDDMQKILDAGNVDINHKYNEGDTPLMLSVATNQFDISKLLLERGAKVDVQNEKETDIWRAFLYGSPIGEYYIYATSDRVGSLNLLKLLIKYGLNIEDEHFRTLIENNKSAKLRSDKYKEYRDVIQEFLPALIEYNKDKKSIDADYMKKDKSYKAKIETPFKYFMFEVYPEILKNKFNSLLEGTSSSSSSLSSSSSSSMISSSSPSSSSAEASGN